MVGTTVPRSADAPHRGELRMAGSSFGAWVFAIPPSQDRGSAKTPT